MEKGYRIFKYPFQESEFVHPEPGNRVSIEMPEGARILTAQITREGVPSIWAIVKPEAGKEFRHFVIVWTGNRFDANLDFLDHIATIQERGGALVWHIFEVREPKPPEVKVVPR